ncbi:DUF349 domain-containing protein [Aquiflexum lacus]|uniref:DUF349 domain-containing protein n=1 Tax=Aquiflexum lacus TaxID=2483805 RepID=UPI001E346BD2|nr:DUF349 domain-containing protein [Aquiflexum lacus]
MSNDKEMSDKDKVTHAQEEIQKAEGKDENSEKIESSNSENPEKGENELAKEDAVLESAKTEDIKQVIDESGPVSEIKSNEAIAPLDEKNVSLVESKVESTIEPEIDTKKDAGETAKPIVEEISLEESTDSVATEITLTEVSVTETENIEESQIPINAEDTTPETSSEVKDDTQSDEENEEQGEIEEDTHVDYSNYTKKQLLSSFKELLLNDKFFKNDTSLAEIKSQFEEIFNHEKEEALNDFVTNGGNADDFEYRPTDEDKAMFVVFNEFRERKSLFFKEQERQKEKNLSAKNQILDKLRELVDGEETTHSINTIKQIQDEWKKIGPVPGSQNRNLWASYNALMDRFYDNRSIYFELKELDRKKNLEQKLEICEKAESLFALPDLKEAIKILNDLHEEFKHIGPVPRDEQEDLWNRFKSASDAVYSRRKEFYDNQKGTLIENLAKKQDLILKLESYKDFSASKIKDWNVKTKEVLAIQKDWEAIGPIPRENGKDINKQFWGHFKQFFQNKNHFFKELDEIRLSNKVKAEELIEKATALQESTDWQQTASQLISLQQEWKKIGPTPEKVRDELYKKFKLACDTFFENRRNSTKQINKEFDENLKTKEALCQKIIEDSKGSDLSESALEALISEFNAIGFVPRKNMKEIMAKFNEAVDTYVKNMGIGGGEKEEFLFRLNLNKLQTDPNSNRVLNKKEHGIRKQISDLENNITLWKNNLEFFAASKTADKLKDQFDEKIRKAETEVEKLKKKLTIIREF